ncbi:unnamed protein product [Tilletia caries]|nr:unnamed protein product [Tilletia caries]CAD6901069.1 unnamed protein product [Tilletia caries]
MDDDAVEQVLFVAREAYVYRVPPRSSTAGYRAAEWGDMEAFLWKGRLRIIAKGEGCDIRLEDKDTGELFAVSPYDMSGAAVEPVLDSSRYFVLRVESEDPSNAAKKRRAYIGMGFLDRSESFDFQVALSEWVRRTRAAKAGDNASENADEAGSSGPSPHLPAGPKVDLSLKEGTTFSIKLPGGGKRIDRSGGPFKIGSTAVYSRDLARPKALGTWKPRLNHHLCKDILIHRSQAGQTMKFRANVLDVNTLSRIAQSVNKVSNRCIISLEKEAFCIICVGDPDGLQIWAKLQTDKFFDEFRIQSNNENRISIEIASETFLKALRSGLNASNVTIRLAKRNKKTPLLNFTISSASHTGATLVVVQDVLIRILKPAELDRLREPLCPSADVHITLPPLLKLRTVCDRMRALADVVHVSANRQGKFKLKIQEDEITMETCWRNLQHPEMPMAANEIEPPEELFRGVALELKSVARFLGSYVVETTTIACICKDHCAIFYVYIGDMQKGKGVMSFFVPGVEVDSR